MSSSNLPGKAVSVLLAVLAAVGLYRYAIQESPAQNQTLFTVEPAVVRVAATSERDTIPATLTLRSFSKDPLKVVGARTTCPCVAAEDHFPFTLAPYESRAMHFSVHMNDAIRKYTGTIANVGFFVEAVTRPIGVDFVVGDEDASREGDVPIE